MGAEAFYVQLVIALAGGLKGRLVRVVCPPAIDCNSGVGGAGPVPVSAETEQRPRRDIAQPARRRLGDGTGLAQRWHRDGTEMARTLQGRYKGSEVMATARRWHGDEHRARRRHRDAAEIVPTETAQRFTDTAQVYLLF